jgi:hypothetical protein
MRIPSKKQEKSRASLALYSALKMEAIYPSETLITQNVVH